LGRTCVAGLVALGVPPSAAQGICVAAPDLAGDVIRYVEGR
jgi:hypothetical protein